MRWPQWFTLGSSLLVAACSALPASPSGSSTGPGGVATSSGSSNGGNGTSATSGGSAAAGATTSGSSGAGNASIGTSGGTAAGGSTTGGSTTGGLPPGSPCASNAACESDACGIVGTGNCCTAACAAVADPTCSAIACDATGACVYPSGASCGTDSCSDGIGTTHACDPSGACQPSTAACPDGLGCNVAATQCVTDCSDAGCFFPYFCVLDSGVCAPKKNFGPCTEGDACLSGDCGLAGTGNCCASGPCTVGAPCGASGCDATIGACIYPDKSVLCGSVNESCSGSTQQDPSACDGTGTCDTAPGTTDCTPYVCGESACLASCTDDTSCGPKDFCDLGNSACCVGLLSDGSGAIAVDSVVGSDATACCGMGSAGPCASIAKAMKLIDESQAQNVSVTVTVDGGGGDWAAANEVYPIVLGWGVELSAPGIFFDDVNANAEIFDITAVSANDMVGYASLFGSAAKQVSIGINSTNTVQTEDPSAIQVEAGSTLHIANAMVNGNPSPASGTGTTAITVTAGGGLWLGADQAGLSIGTVNIGGQFVLDGYNGIVCTSGNGLGCTIQDGLMHGGASGVVIQNQHGVDIDAEDFASISLTSAPVIGLPPAAPGFQQCSTKDDSFALESEAVLLNGAVTMTFQNGTLSCISGGGFRLQGTANGSPTLFLDSSTVENTELGVYTKAGAALITNTTIQYNYVGLEQDGTGTISLGDGGNAVVCSSSAETVLASTGYPGVSVLNASSQVLDATNAVWDTADPDVFQCDATFATCTCQISSCTVDDGADGMDAVFESSAGTIATNGNSRLVTGCTPDAG